MVRKKKSGFGKPAHQPDDRPTHLKLGKTVPSPLINRSPEDYSWLGDDGLWNPKQALDEMTSPPALLRLIVQTIIEAYPSPTKRPDDRVEGAMRALLGSQGRKGRRTLSSDGPILRRMANEYLQGFYGFKVPFPSLNALAEWALSVETDFANGNEEWKTNRRRTISRKFQNGKDQLLSEFSSADDLEMKQALSKVRAAIEALACLGVKTEPRNDRKDKIH